MLQMYSEFKLWAITIAKAVSLCKAFLFHCFLFYFVEMFFPPVLEANEMLRKTSDESVTNKKIIFCIYIFYPSFSFVPFFLSFFFFFRYSCVRNTDNVAISTIDICFSENVKDSYFIFWGKSTKHLPRIVDP